MYNIVKCLIVREIIMCDTCDNDDSVLLDRRLSFDLQSAKVMCKKKS